jgi:3-hydroxyisobutyrate dehydrogenase
MRQSLAEILARATERLPLWLAVMRSVLTDACRFSKKLERRKTGNGQAVKLCNQILCAVNMIAVCESLSLAEELSIDPNLMIEVCSSGAAGSWALANLGPRIIANNLEPGFMIKDMQKDLRLVREAISGSALNFAGRDLADQKFNDAIAALSPGGELKGTQAMIAAYRDLAAENN